jgi:hypothetical protein
LLYERRKTKKVDMTRETETPRNPTEGTLLTKDKRVPSNSERNVLKSLKTN